MLNNKKKTSKAEEGSSKGHSVLDFLYHDSRRIGSFLSQFEQFGLLSSITQTKGTDKGQHQGSISAAGVSAAGFVSGRVENSEGVSSGLSDSSERVYDPFWSNARAFLDHLSEHDMIQTDIEAARMGQFVMIKGALVVSDLKMLQNLWKVEAVKKYIKQEALRNQSQKATW